MTGCSTGLNVVTGGGEVVGLVCGWLAAGARGVLVTLWDVNDRSTTGFMEAFYAGLTTGASGPAPSARPGSAGSARVPRSSTSRSRHAPISCVALVSRPAASRWRRIWSPGVRGRVGLSPPSRRRAMWCATTGHPVGAIQWQRERPN